MPSPIPPSTHLYHRYRDSNDVLQSKKLEEDQDDINNDNAARPPRSFRFNSCMQRIHCLRQRASGPVEKFLSRLRTFLHTTTDTYLPEGIAAAPKCHGTHVDLYKLFQTVHKHGGPKAVSLALSRYDC